MELSEVWGICKAYTTRVGSGPFPTEATGQYGKLLREVGHEYGTTTGRPRRCGWLDLVALRYASRVNGFTGLCITKLDVLNDMKKIKVCTAYKYRGDVINELPYDQAKFAECEPVYEELPGWEGDISEAKSIQELPQETIDYLNLIISNVRVPISLISVGPKREQHIKVPYPNVGRNGQRGEGDEQGYAQ